LKSSNKKPKSKKHSKLVDKGPRDEVWDTLVDSLSDDSDFISETIKESDTIDKLYGTNKTKKASAPVSHVQIIVRDNSKEDDVSEDAEESKQPLKKVLSKKQASRV